MERRALVAIVLSVALLLAWQFLFAPPTPPPRPSEERGSTPAATAPTGPTSPAREGPAFVPRTAPGPIAPPTGAAATVNTPHYRATFAADGSVADWVLHYRGDKP